jgi:hypothetical protein
MRMCPTDLDPGETPDARFPLPVRLAAYLAPAVLGTVAATALGFWVTRTPESTHLEVWSRVLEQLRAEYLGSGGARRFLADLLCVFPWSLAAFVRSGRFATFARAPHGIGLVLRVLGLTLFFNVFGHAVRGPWDVTAENVRMLLANTVALSPSHVAFSAAAVVFSRLPGRALTAWGLVLVSVLLFRLLLPDLFGGQPVVDGATGRVLIFPPTPEARMALLGPLLGVWGLFTLLELRIDVASR